MNKRGWFGEPIRHGLAAKSVKTTDTLSAEANSGIGAFHYTVSDEVVVDANEIDKFINFLKDKLDIHYSVSTFYPEVILDDPRIVAQARHEWGTNYVDIYVSTDAVKFVAENFPDDAWDFLVRTIGHEIHHAYMYQELSREEFKELESGEYDAIEYRADEFGEALSNIDDKAHTKILEALDQRGV